MSTKSLSQNTLKEDSLRGTERRIPLQRKQLKKLSEPCGHSSINRNSSTHGTYLPDLTFTSTGTFNMLIVTVTKVGCLLLGKVTMTRECC